jgi:hypothetical protein
LFSPFKMQNWWLFVYNFSTVQVKCGNNQVMLSKYPGIAKNWSAALQKLKILILYPACSSNMKTYNWMFITMAGEPRLRTARSRSTFAQFALSPISSHVLPAKVDHYILYKILTLNAFKSTKSGHYYIIYPGSNHYIHFGFHGHCDSNTQL